MPLLMATPPAPLQVLSLAGGGYLGLYTAAVLEGLEAQAGEPLARRFDLVLGPKYSGTALREALQADFGDRRLADALHRVVVPAVDVGECRTKVFKTPHAQESLGDGNLRVVDVAMAACAAPAYFPSVRIGKKLYADRGLFAVAPDQVALHELEHFIGADLARVHMLSVGTATAHYRPAEGVMDDAGAVGWLSQGRLILTLIAVQQQHVQAMLEDRLGERYLRLDADWPAQGGLGIDVATPQAARLLLSLANGTLRGVHLQGLRRFLEPVAANDEARAAPSCHLHAARAAPNPGETEHDLRSA